MKKVETRLDDVTVAKIEATGKSMYEFLQEAVALKLQNDNVINLQNSFERKLKEFERQIEDKIIEGVAAQHNILKQSIEKDKEYKEKTVENLRKISARIKD